MFCPKCGVQGGDESKFCRGCGADLSRVLAVIDGRQPEAVGGLSEKYVEQFSRGVRGLFMGGGFMVVGVGAYLITTNAPVSLFALLMAFVFLGTGFSRLIHAAGLRRLSQGDALLTLDEGRADYLKPAGSIYDTDELAQPMSVTDRTTRHLKIEE